MNKRTEISRINPNTVANPVGQYSHVTVLPSNATIYTFSGQIGADIEGNIPSDFNRQVDYTFKNIKALLTSQQLTSKNIIKVNIWATQEINWGYFEEKWEQLFNSSYPSMTIAYVTALGLPEISLEIEIWAAK